MDSVDPLAAHTDAATSPLTMKHGGDEFSPPTTPKRTPKVGPIGRESGTPLVSSSTCSAPPSPLPSPRSGNPDRSLGSVSSESDEDVLSHQHSSQPEDPHGSAAPTLSPGRSWRSTTAPEVPALAGAAAVVAETPVQPTRPHSAPRTRPELAPSPLLVAATSPPRHQRTSSAVTDIYANDVPTDDAVTPAASERENPRAAPTRATAGRKTARSNILLLSFWVNLTPCQTRVWLTALFAASLLLLAFGVLSAWARGLILPRPPPYSHYDPVLQSHVSIKRPRPCGGTLHGILAALASFALLDGVMLALWTAAFARCVLPKLRAGNDDADRAIADAGCCAGDCGPDEGCATVLRSADAVVPATDAGPAPPPVAGREPTARVVTAWTAADPFFTPFICFCTALAMCLLVLTGLAAAGIYISYSADGDLIEACPKPFKMARGVSLLVLLTVAAYGAAFALHSFCARREGQTVLTTQAPPSAVAY